MTEISLIFELDLHPAGFAPVIHSTSLYGQTGRTQIVLHLI
jgi:hypothetical protein